MLVALVAPFKGLHYNLAKVPNLTEVVTPPYDVIKPAEQEALAARHPHNMVHLILPRALPGDDRLQNRYTRAAALFRQWQQAVTADAHLSDNQELNIGSLAVRVLHTPGHSPGHVVYYLPREQVLVGGDLIIGGSIGRTDLPDSDPEQMVASLRRVMRLPAATRLLAGHGRATTLGEERQTNPYVQEILE